MDLPSTKPYLLRALYEWCCDNGFTPYVTVVVDAQTVVPAEFVRDGQITLNIGPDATSRLLIDNERLTCAARFGGVARELSVPVVRVAAIYARENGAGMAFEVEEAPTAAAGVEPLPEPPATPPAGGGRPKLQRVK